MLEFVSFLNKNLNILVGNPWTFAWVLTVRNGGDIFDRSLVNPIDFSP